MAEFVDESRAHVQEHRDLSHRQQMLMRAGIGRQLAHHRPHQLASRHIHSVRRYLNPGPRQLVSFYGLRTDATRYDPMGFLSLGFGSRGYPSRLRRYGRAAVEQPDCR